MSLFLTLIQLLKSSFQLALESKCVTFLGFEVAKASYEIVFFFSEKLFKQSLIRDEVSYVQLGSSC